MISRRQFLSVVLLLPLLLRSVAAAGETPPPRTLRVLFIGNSYTHVNDLPGMIAQLLSARGIKLEHESVTPGGATLEKQWTDGKALAAIRQRKWDYVVLQEQSMRPFRDRDAMFKAARLLHAEIEKTGAKTLLYETWAAKASPDEQPKLTDAYEALGRELGARVVPVGEAWKKAIAAGIELHGGDGRHPSRDGSYLAACLFVATLAGDSPVGLPNKGTAAGKPWTVAEAAALQRIAALVAAERKPESTGLIVNRSLAGVKIAEAPAGAPLSQRYQVRLRPAGTESWRNVPVNCFFQQHEYNWASTTESHFVTFESTGGIEVEVNDLPRTGYGG